MKRIFVMLIAAVMLCSIISCSKKTEQTDDTQKLVSPVTEDDMFCICAEFDSEANLFELLETAQYELTDLATGSMHEAGLKLLHTDDSDMFIYEFDDAYLAGKAYNNILKGHCDGAYPTNFMGLSGSLVRIGRFIADDSLAGEGTGKTLRILLGLCDIEAPKAQPQGTYPVRISKGECNLTVKELRKKLKDEVYTVVSLEAALHGAQESYLILEDNGVIAGRLDVRASEGIEGYADAVKEAYNSRISIRYTDTGYMLFSWYEDCLTCAFTDVVSQNGNSDSSKSDTNSSDKN